MTRPLSLDLRERVVAAAFAGESCRSVAARFGVAVSSVVKWSQRHRATGSVVPGSPFEEKSKSEGKLTVRTADGTTVSKLVNIGARHPGGPAGRTPSKSL